MIRVVAFSEFCQDAAGAGGPFPRAGIFRRMVRRDEWKLNYYAGQPSQLFHLKEDPDELHDRSGDAACADVVKTLTEEVLVGWDPKEIAQKMADKRADNQVLSAWAKQTQPKDHVRWDLRPEMDYLE